MRNTTGCDNLQATLYKDYTFAYEGTFQAKLTDNNRLCKFSRRIVSCYRALNNSVTKEYIFPLESHDETLMDDWIAANKRNT